MPRFAARWRLTVLLVILCLVSGWNLLEQYRGQPNIYDFASHYVQTIANGGDGAGKTARISRRGGAPPSATVTLLPAPSWKVAALPTLADTVSRPLFKASRRPPVASPAEAPATLPELKLTLIGIVVANEQRTAILRLNGPARSGDRRQIMRMIPGNAYKGWRLEEVGDDRVRFAGDGKTLEFVLEFEKPAPPPRRKRKAGAPRKIPPATKPPPDRLQKKQN